MKKLILTFTLFTGIFGCGTCPDYDGFYFDIFGLVIFNMEQRSPNAHYGVEEGTSLEFENHSFSISYMANYYSLNQSNSLSLVSPAFATSCIDSGNGGSQEYLDTIIVTTNYDMDATHLKGESINDIIRYNGEMLNSFLNADSIEIPHQTFSLELTQKPELSNSLSINVFVKLLNGEEYTSTSERVILK